MPNMVEVKNVTKKFKHVTALKDVSITFEQGKIHGVIGRNGSGKTVMFKCICGFMEPSAGEIYINGKRVIPARMQDIGIIIEDPGFIPGMNAFRFLNAFMPGMKPGSSMMMPMSCIRAGITRLPLTKICPSLGSMKPQMHLNMTVLPEPFLPMTP